MSLKDNGKSFSGHLEECWRDYRDDCDQVSEDYNLIPKQQLQFMHNILQKDAHRFFLESVRPIEKTYLEAASYLKIVQLNRPPNPYLKPLEWSSSRTIF